MEELKEASESLKGKVLMSWSLTETSEEGGMDARLAEYIGVTKAMVPTVRVVDTSGGDVKKYAMESDVTAENMVQFWEDFSAGKV